MIQELEYLLALARHRHFGRAAASCNVSQPTLSVAIRRLEHQLGVGVVLRGHRFEGFTEEGLRVVAWAHRILAERDEMLADVRRVRAGLSATARIGAIPTSLSAAPLLTRAFLAANPAATVRVESLSSRDIAGRLAEFEISAGLTYLDAETPPGTRRIELYHERYALMAPLELEVMRQPVVGWAEAAELSLCALTVAMRNRRIIDARMTADGIDFRPIIESDTVGGLYAHMAMMAIGSIVAHPWLHAFGVPAGYAVRPMVQLEPDPSIGLLVLDREPASIVAEALVVAAADADMEGELGRSFDALVLGRTPDTDGS